MPSFGETLRRERELRGVSLREISDATKISVRFLQALEQDRLEVLPGGVFRRAFVKQYGKHLGLDAERLVAEFVYAHGEHAPDQPAPRKRGGSNLGTLLMISIFGTAAVLSLWNAAPQRAQRESSVPIARLERPQELRAPEPVVVAAPSGLVLTLQAHQTCWVEVRADGQTLLNRVLEQGQSETLFADREIVLSVGNAGGVNFTINDRPGLPLGKSGEVRRNIVITSQSLHSLVEESQKLRASHGS